ncbi:MAG: hypothetical protein FWD13_04275 [Treponema sp.]|nr:hypothetical protein [Treponema sp.]
MKHPSNNTQEQYNDKDNLSLSNTMSAYLKRKEIREAADTGLLLWKENFLLFLPFFAIPFWVCAFSLRIILPDNLMLLSWFFIWLLKPLFDRLILHVISIRFFEKNAGLKRLCRGLGRSLWRGLIGDLLWRRFSPLRSAMMPVRVLEYNIKTGSGISQRKKNLKKGGIGYCSLLTVWGIAVEIALLAGEILFVIAMAELISKGMIASVGNLPNVMIFIYAAWCFNYMLVETIYVCMGFSIYINSRIIIEGWDIEIFFRNFAKKHKNKINNVLLIVIIFTCLFMPVKGYAYDDHVPLDELQVILDSPEFGSEEDTWGIRLKKPIQLNNDMEFDMDRMSRVRQIIALIFRFIIIGSIAGLIFFLIQYLRKTGKSSSGRIKNVTKKIQHKKHGEDIKQLLDKAFEFYKKGEIRLAWGYCTAAVIQSWTSYKSIVFPPNATESDCLNIVNLKAAGSPEAFTFNTIIKNWIYLAYAGRLPPEGSFEEAAALCDRIRTENG